MRIPTLSALLTGCAIIAGCAATPAERARDQADAVSTQKRLTARLAGFTPGQPTDCLPPLPQTHSEAFGSKILYTASSRLVYVNDTTGGCESMERGDYLVTVSHEGRTCRGDIGQTFQPIVRVPTGSCALGSFTPYERK